MLRFLGVGGGASGQSVYPIESFWALLLERTDTFFGWPYVGLALLGLLLGGREVMKTRIVPAWILTYLLLILLRAKVPDLFRYGHETLFVTPLVALLSGFTLIFAWRRGGALRFASVVAGLGLVIGSLGTQLIYLADQLGNAR